MAQDIIGFIDEWISEGYNTERWRRYPKSEEDANWERAVESVVLQLNEHERRLLRLRLKGRTATPFVVKAVRDHHDRR